MLRTSVASRSAILKCLIRQLSSSNESGIDTESILNASLQHVPEHGWSTTAIERGAVSLGLPGVAHGVISRGGVELVEHFEAQCNSRLLEYLKQETQDKSQVRSSQLIQNAVEHRLKMLQPYISRWPEALALKAHPNNASSSLLTFANMLDDMWYYAGDRSTDFNWYTKRGLLAAVYCSTELYMTRDTSVDFHDTWQFLRRRLGDVASITTTRRQVTEITEGTWELAGAGLITALNMLSLNPTRR